MLKQGGSGTDPFFKQSAPQGQGKKEGFFKSKFGNQEKRNHKEFKNGKKDDGSSVKRDFRSVKGAFGNVKGAFGKSRFDNFNSNRHEKNDSSNNNKNFKSVKGAFGKNKSSNFNHNRQESNDDDKLHEIKGGKIEKHFDKKLYRMKKYSNKYKLDQWENQRRKEVLKKYYKDIKNDPMAGKYRPFKFDKGDEGVDETDNKIHYVLNPDRLEEMKQKFGKDKNKKAVDGSNPNVKIKPFRKVKEEMQRLKEEKIAAKEAKLKATKEKEEAIAKYKAKKADRFKKLSKKTKTGQPVMKERMQMLLESIQKTV